MARGDGFAATPPAADGPRRRVAADARGRDVDRPGRRVAALLRRPPRYVAKLRRTIVDGAGAGARPLEGLKVCVNPGHGSGGFFASEVLEPLGADVSSSVHLEPDGTFPAHPANPEDKKHVAATIDAVAASNADVGVMLDTDVDRCGLIDGTRGARDESLVSSRGARRPRCLRVSPPPPRASASRPRTAGGRRPSP